MTDRDRFLEFVERLTADLDDHETSATDMAARAHLSRHHFERIIVAVAGESPTRFRRRVLLERAAYRMVSTDLTIIQIAVDAGFSSHEAFTRAFQRAFHVAPSIWRRRPSKFRLPAPSDVHFHPPAGLRLPARAGENGMDSSDLVVRMVEHHVWMIEQLVTRAQRLTDADLDRPYAAPVEDIDGESLRWMLSRLIGQMEMWTSAMLDQEYDFAVEVHETVVSMQARVSRVGPEFLRQVREVAESGRFDETFVDAFSSRPVVVTYGGMVAHVLTFAAHHKLLAVSRMREYGITDLGFGDPKYWFGP